MRFGLGEFKSLLPATKNKSNRLKGGSLIVGAPTSLATGKGKIRYPKKQRKKPTDFDKSVGGNFILFDKLEFCYFFFL